MPGQGLCSITAVQLAWGVQLQRWGRVCGFWGAVWKSGWGWGILSDSDTKYPLAF